MCTCTKYFKYQPKTFIIDNYRQHSIVDYINKFEKLGCVINGNKSNYRFIIWKPENARVIQLTNERPDIYDKINCVEQCVDNILYSANWEYIENKYYYNRILATIIGWIELYKCLASRDSCLLKNITYFNW